MVTKFEVANLCGELKNEFPSAEIVFSTNRREYLSDGINIAYGKDAAIICVDIIDTESLDRDSIKLPKLWEDIITETARINPKTVVVLYCGSVVDMSAWEHKVAAIISVGYPGERGNAALAKILSGSVNPSGKTTETYPLTEKDSLGMNCYRDFCHSVYSDGILVGYRWYDTARATDREESARVLFPFGHGLSYSTFEYSNLSLATSKDGVSVKFDVTNTSDRDGAECAQVYFRDPISSVFRPYKELCGFEKKLIKANETEHYTVTVPWKNLAFYSVSHDSWITEPGDFEIIVGASCDDIRLTGKITL